MYTCKCGRCFEKKQSYVAHCGHCEVHLGHKPVRKYNTSENSWNKGKTKETDPRIARIAKKFGENHRGENAPFYGKHHTEETKKIMSEKARYNSKNHMNGWKAGSSMVPNKYELFTEEFLMAHSIEHKREVSVKCSELGNTHGSRYLLDFLVLDRIDLEIDGSSHDNEKIKEHDSKRDGFVSNKYIVYRIKHNDSIDTLESKLIDFLDFVRGIDTITDHIYIA